MKVGEMAEQFNIRIKWVVGGQNRRENLGADDLARASILSQFPSELKVILRRK